VDRDLARYVVRSAFRSVGELQQLLPLLKEHASTAEYETYRRAIAAAVASIGDEITNRTLKANPGLADDIDATMEKYGRLI
jgi:hypothetical protein